MSDSKSESLVILGAAGLAEEFGTYAHNMGFTDLVFVDDTENSPTHVKINGESYPVVSDWKFPPHYRHFIVGVGAPHIKKILVDKAWMAGLTPQKTIVHSMAYSASDWLGWGGMVAPGSIITVNVNFGNYVTVNLDCTVGHGTTIAQYTTLNPGVHISGAVNIGHSNMFGTGCTVRDRLNICDNNIFGAQCAVSKDIEVEGTYVGIPAKLLKGKADD